MTKSIVKMKNQLLSILLFVLLANVAFARKPDDRIDQLVKNIKTEVLNSFNIKLTDKEVFDITKMELKKKKGISVEALSEANKRTRRLIEALRQVVEKKADSQKVYLDMNLKDYGYTDGNWSYYLKNYQTEEKIKKLEETIPDTGAKLLGQLSGQYRLVIENYLLNELIIKDFDSANPTKTSMEFYLKISSWWKTRLEKYDLPEEDKQTVLRYLSWPPVVPREEKKDWNEYFKAKLEPSKTDSKTVTPKE